MTRRRVKPSIKPAVFALAGLACLLSACYEHEVFPTPTPFPNPHADDTRLVRLSHTDYVDEEKAVWSPRGDKIAFECTFVDPDWWPYSGYSTPSRNREVRNWTIHSRLWPASICVVNADGSGRIQLTGDETAEEDPAWSPDGSKIAFSSYRNGNTDIFVIDADGAGLTRLTFDEASDETPAWSPDGNRIAFSSNRSDNRNIYVMNTDGSDVRPIVVDMFNSLRPAWSPDGSKIAFTSYVVSGDDSHVYVVDADGSNLTRVSNGPGSHSDPSWSPDGNRIAYDSRIGEDSSLHIVNADGSVRTLLYEARPLVNEVEWVTTPEWSPDGSRIAFAAGVRPSDSGPYYAEIHTINIDGSGLIRLTGRSGADWQPSWNPDGNKLAFTSEPILGHSEIYITWYR